MIDFTKAFDTVDHIILLNKLSQLSLPGYVINWICSFCPVEVNSVKLMVCCLM